MNFKTSKLKIFISIIVGMFGLFGVTLIGCIGKCLPRYTLIKNAFIAFLVYGGIVYLIWSLVQKKH